MVCFRICEELVAERMGIVRLTVIDRTKSHPIGSSSRNGTALTIETGSDDSLARRFRPLAVFRLI